MCLDPGGKTALLGMDRWVFMPLRALDVFGPYAAFTDWCEHNHVFMPLRALDVFGPLVRCSYLGPTTIASSCP